ncbi:alpha/beta fold hydrolase [Candidatus Mycobacterium methanotrophicum]|uniref:Alpha/beta hydrolase n=1 Tax=Candidatus Mycobacterium methanotrophicum TaxID=2943498 RepID=A0ABY4QQQ3_9MYCO|nr:alpha/beta hydrolase [Candidatus Mycobacterium methanotrophicum]UQX12285.1 alpha/beta hydrolase [Candidatus Mycobacterium methanotrophicum]
MPYIQTAEQFSLFYTDYPGNEPVVFAHAWALNGDMWGYQLTELMAAGFRCITYDRRGHGRSDRPPTGYDIDTLADDLAALIEQLDLSDITLIGHSMGSGEVVRYLTRHGAGRVARVVLSGTVTPMLLQGPDNPEGIPDELAAQSREVMLRDIGDWMEISGKAEYFYGEHRVSQQLMDWTLNTIAAVPLPILTRTSDAFVRADFRSEFAELTVPTLLIHGTADASMPIDLTARKTVSLIPDCRLMTIDGAGHGLYLSESRRYNAALLEFITSTRAPAGAVASG